MIILFFKKRGLKTLNTHRVQQTIHYIGQKCVNQQQYTIHYHFKIQCFVMLKKVKYFSNYCNYK